MSDFDPRSLLDRIMGTCVRLLIAAGALYLAVHLFLSVATVVYIAVGVTGLVGIAVALWRRYRGW
jgi:hypothetical protein